MKINTVNITLYQGDDIEVNIRLLEDGVAAVLNVADAKITIVPVQSRVKGNPTNIDLALNNGITFNNEIVTILFAGNKTKDWSGIGLADLVIQTDQGVWTTLFRMNINILEQYSNQYV